MARWYKFWKSRRARLTAGISTCPHCGALYEVTYTRMEARDDDRAICDKCHKVMKEWNDTFSRSFKLKVGSAKRRDRRYLAGPSKMGRRSYRRLHCSSPLKVLAIR